MDYNEKLIDIGGLSGNLSDLMNIIDTETIGMQCFHDMFESFVTKGTSVEGVDNLIDEFDTHAAITESDLLPTEEGVKTLFYAWQAARVLVAFFEGAHTELSDALEAIS